MDITFVTTAETNDESKALLKEFGYHLWKLIKKHSYGKGINEKPESVNKTKTELKNLADKRAALKSGRWLEGIYKKKKKKIITKNSFCC